MMLGNRTRTAKAVARHQSAVIAQDGAAAQVRAAGSRKAVAVVSGEVAQTKQDVSALNGRVTDLEDGTDEP